MCIAVEITDPRKGSASFSVKGYPFFCTLVLALVYWKPFQSGGERHAHTYVELHECIGIEGDFFVQSSLIRAAEGFAQPYLQ